MIVGYVDKIFRPQKGGIPIIQAAVQASGIEEPKLLREGALREAKRLHAQPRK